jgi:hypothetical protein
MNVRAIAELLSARIHTGDHNLDLEVKSACGADLMSDVMAFVKEDVVLLTGLVNAQTVRTAHLLDIPVIVFVRGKVPEPELVEEAIRDGIVLMTTNDTLFIACGRLYEAGIKTGGNRKVD